MPPVRWKRNPAVVARRIGERTILVPTGRGIVDHKSLFTLNDTGSHVWEQLVSPRTVDDLNRSLAQEFDITPEEARTDVERFLADLAAAGCIHES